MWFLVTVDMLKRMHVDDRPAQHVAYKQFQTVLS